jgi:hypothetical protein
MKFGTLLDKLAKKSGGVDTSKQNFIDLLSSNLEIPDEIVEALDKGLMNIDAAKNNPEVRKVMKAETLNGLDSKVLDILEEFGIETIDDIKNEKNSFEKVSKMVKVIKEDIEKKTKGAGKLDKDGYDKQVADLNKLLKEHKDLLANKEKEWNDTRESDHTTFDIQKLLMGKDYAFPKEMDADLKLQTAYAAVNKQLQGKGLKIIRNENKQPVIVDKENKPAYNDKHEALELASFIDGALAQNKLLRVNDQNPDNGSGNNHTVQLDGNGQPAKTPANFQQGISQLDQMIADASKS